jgi:diguanylate cyclase (GGDEF)-like protein/PAS domain S-box-containing protein
MAEGHTKKPPGRRPDRLLFPLIIVALIVVWGLAISYALSERSIELDHAKSRLAATVSSLADFSELAEKSATKNPNEMTEERTSAIWRALLQYPTASIWVEASGRIIDGQPSTGELGPYIFVKEERPDFIVRAALPEADVLADWRWEARWAGAALSAITLAFLIMTQILTRAIRRRSEAETDAELERGRVSQLSGFQVELAKTVAERTRELRETNTALQTELHERQAAEEALRQHDALLNAVTRGAAELLGSHGYEDATAVVLELIGQVVGVARVRFYTIAPSDDGHLHATAALEWCAPGQPPTIDNPTFRNLDLNVLLPKSIVPLLNGQYYAYFVTDFAEDRQEQYLKAQMRSFLQIPIMIEGKLWGLLIFSDSTNTQRKWNWAETDALGTLAGLIGVAVIRARYVKELTDANMIVQNSPTILYRLRGEPSLPLTYISPNIAKFGYDPAELLAAPNWSERLIDPDDQPQFGEAMTKVLQKGSSGGSIEFRLRTADGTRRSVENRYTPVRDKLGRLVEIEGIIIDITERKVAEEQIALLARTDGLTGLANRMTFIDRLRQVLATAKRGGSPFAVLYIDVDHFKDVNDTLGHPIGDILLKEIADRLKASTRDEDVVARLGGDEFAILQTDVSDPTRAGGLATKLLHALAALYVLRGNHVRITVSIGIATYVPETSAPDTLLVQADLALYRAKEQGRNQYRFHTEDLDDAVRERVLLSAELRDAIEKGQLELYYQPQVEVVSGAIVGAEALIRWNHPTRGQLLPADFLPVAEQTGTIMPLGHWVLDRACRQMRQWRTEGVAPHVITINLSLAQLRNTRELVQDVVDALAKWDLMAGELEFDVTEATLAQLKWNRNDVLIQLRRLGVKIAIDDFGMEYSSFDYLKSYNVNHLKIARALIAEAVTNPDKADMVRVMIALARELGISVMAEGVETEQQRTLLIATGSPTKAQGFYFSEPVNATRFHALLEQRHIKPMPAAAGASPLEPDLKPRNGSKVPSR